MNWQEVVESPYLQNLPFKIETNEFGEIIMNPVKIGHSIYQGEISSVMKNMRPEGVVMVECAIKTRKGTKVADVAWASMTVIDQIEKETDASVAPEICVEVLSMSNSDKEIVGKRRLYFERGAVEVWTCDGYGEMRFFDAGGKLEQSKMFPEFPKQIKIR
jgi:Uma2 family endonuclease